jgi:hypothetical protein
LLVAGVLTAAGAVLAACGGNTAAPQPAPTTSAASGTTVRTIDSTPTGTALPNTPVTPVPNGPVLPVKVNPIINTASAQTLRIDSVIVENNVDAGGKAASDHLEVAMTNTGATPLSGFEVFYTFTDPSTAITESYYAKLPDSFSIAPGAQRVAHFDKTGQPDHFAVNEFSLYYTDTNALEVTVTVSANGAAVQSVTVKKDAGGAETAD